MCDITQVSCKYGSPMGRWECPHILEIPHSLYCFNIPLDSGGYDKGGAYWGIDKRLYCISQRDNQEPDIYGNQTYYRQFIRANTRQEAILASGQPLELFKRGIIC